MKKHILALILILLFPALALPQGACVLKQSTASQEIAIGRFVDSTDGDTEMTGLTIANTDIRLKKGAADWAAKNSGGATHEEAGMYRITLDATDTATLGILEIAVHVSGALYVNKTCLVTNSGFYDVAVTTGPATAPTNYSLLSIDASGRIDAGKILGTAIATPATAGVLDVNVKNINNQTASASGTVTFPNATLASTTNITAATVTALADNVITAASINTDAIGAAEIAADAIGASEIAGGAITSSEAPNLDAAVSSRASPAVKRNTGFQWAIQMVTSALVPVTSGTPACTRSIDAPASFAGSISATAVSSEGWSEITLADGDLNGTDYVILKCTLTGARNFYEKFKLQAP